MRVGLIDTNQTQLPGRYGCHSQAISDQVEERGVSGEQLLLRGCHWVMPSPRLYDISMPTRRSAQHLSPPPGRRPVVAGHVVAFGSSDRFPRDFWLSPTVLLTKKTPVSTLNQFCSRHGFRVTDLGGNETMDRRDAMFQLLASQGWPEGYDAFMIARNSGSRAPIGSPRASSSQSPSTPANASYLRPKSARSLRESRPSYEAQESVPFVAETPAYREYEDYEETSLYRVKVRLSPSHSTIRDASMPPPRIAPRSPAAAASARPRRPPVGHGRPRPAAFAHATPLTLTRRHAVCADRALGGACSLRRQRAQREAPPLLPRPAPSAAARE